MFETTRGMLAPAGRRLLPLIVALIAAAPIAAQADRGMVDVRTLPRLEGAVEETARTESYRMNYSVPTVVPITTAATRKLLAADGWKEYVHPSSQSSRPMSFKKGAHGLFVSFSQFPGRPDQSVVYYSAERLYADVPFPADATDIVYDSRRPYLSCTSAATVEASLEFFRAGLLAAGWSALSASDIAARWPNAMPDAAFATGGRTYYGRDVRDGGPRQPPIVLNLQRSGDGKTAVEIKVAPFALPQNLEVARDAIGLPMPDSTSGLASTGSSDSIRRRVGGNVAAELPAVLTFFRRELDARSWTEEPNASVTGAEAILHFASTDQTAQLTLTHKYGLTFVNLVTQVKESALAARAKAKKVADEKFFRDAQTTAQQLIAADEARRVAQAAGLSDAPLRAVADPSKPVPMPEGAENVNFDGADGRLEFSSASSVKALAAFYRGSLTSLGWQEQPSVINRPNMAVMRFSKGGKALSFTAMQMGPKVNIRADGSGLVMAAAKSGTATEASSSVAPQTAVQDLEAEPDSALPVPKQRSMRMMGTGKVPGSDAPFRRNLEASIPADMSTVLAFYRSELGKRGWKETGEGAILKPEQVRLAFVSPDGPAVLRLGRNKGETSVDLAQRYPAVAAQADVIPKPGQARLVFGNMGNSEVSLSINKQTVRIAGGAGGPKSPDRPKLDVPAGKHTYSVKVAGRPAKSDTIEVTADDAWGMMIAPDGEVLSLQIY